MLLIILFSWFSLATEIPQDSTCEDKAAWGFVDANGKNIVKHQYRDVRPFSQGLAAVQIKRGLWGYIDRSGKWKIRPRFNYAQSFVKDSKVYACVEDDKGKRFIIDEVGRPQAFRFPGCYSPNSELTKQFYGRRRGYFNKKGKLIISISSMDYEGYPNEFIGEYVSFYKYNGQCGIMDREGKRIYIKTRDKCFPKPLQKGFPIRFYSVRKNKKKGSEIVKYGLADWKGNVIVSPKYDDIGSFQSGLAAVRFSNDEDNAKSTYGGWGFINRSGEIITSQRYDHTFFVGFDLNRGTDENEPRFSEKIAILRKTTKGYNSFDWKTSDWIFLNTKGKEIFDFRARISGEMREGLFFREGERITPGFYDKTGQLKLDMKPYYGHHYHVSEGRVGVCRIK